MRPIKVPKESLNTGGTIWDVAGKSPANSPSAYIQSANMFLSILKDERLGPMSGLQVHPLVQVLLEHSPLVSTKGVQLSLDETKRLNTAPPIGPGGPPPGIPGAGPMAPADGGMAAGTGDGGLSGLPAAPPPGV